MRAPMAPSATTLLILCGLFLVLPMASGTASAQALVNGGSVNGAISVSGEQDSYTFAANAGEGFQLRMADINTTLLTPEMTVYGPGGAYAGSSSEYLVAHLSLIAGSTGTYTVVVGDGNTFVDKTGPYSIVVNGAGAVPVPISPIASALMALLLVATATLALRSRGTTNSARF